MLLDANDTHRAKKKQRQARNPRGKGRTQETKEEGEEEEEEDQTALHHKDETQERERKEVTTNKRNKRQEEEEEEDRKRKKSNFCWPSFLRRMVVRIPLPNWLATLMVPIRFSRGVSDSGVLVAEKMVLRSCVSDCARMVSQLKFQNSSTEVTRHGVLRPWTHRSVSPYVVPPVVMEIWEVCAGAGE